MSEAPFNLRGDANSHKLNRITLFNPSPYHVGTNVAAGGFGFSPSDEAPVSLFKQEVLRHMNGQEARYYTTASFSAQLIYASERYYVLEGINAEGRYESRIVSSFIESPFPNIKCRYCQSLFLMLPDDTRMWELRLKGHVVTLSKSAIDAVYDAAKAVANDRGLPYPWLVLPTFKAAQPVLVGKSNAKSPVTPISVEDLDKIASKEQCERAYEARLQLEEILRDGWLKPRNLSDLKTTPALQAPEF